MRHFNRTEFKCTCCGENQINPEFLEMLDEARDIAGFPFVITSGFRCHDHNQVVGGVEGSSHTKGFAADFSVTNSSRRYRALQALLEVGFKRIGMGGDFIHVDTDPHKPESVIWTYL